MLNHPLLGHRACRWRGGRRPYQGDAVVLGMEGWSSSIDYHRNHPGRGM